MIPILPFRFWHLLLSLAALTQFGTVAGCAAEPLPGERLCLSPDCLQVDNIHSKKGAVKSIGILDTSLHLYIWVPPATASFTLGVFDQNDDGPTGKASEFKLISPDGKDSTVLGNPLPGAWSEYPVQTAGRWGVWCLNVRGPEDGGGADEDGAPAKKANGAKAINLFMVRTRGDVDLYLHPEAVARVRGLRLAAAHFGGETSHHLYVGAPGADNLLFSWLHAATSASAPEAGNEDGGPALHLDWPGSTVARQPLDGDDRLAHGLVFETVAFQGGRALTPEQRISLTLQPGGESYGLGVEQSARLFFNSQPLFPQLRPVRVTVTDEANHPLAARLTATSDRTLNEPATFYTASNGAATFWALPGVSYHLVAGGGPGYSPAQADMTAEPTVRLVLKPALQRLTGWYSGDTHCHTWLYDGSDSPAQMVEAARAAGLDWFVISEHAHSPFVERSRRATQEATAAAAAGPPDFVIIPGLEYTGPRFHANVLGAAVAIPSGASLADVVEQARAANSGAAPVAVQVNHPSLGATAAQIARETPGLPMMELWNSPEPAASALWFDLLNRGARVLADTGSDSHNRQNLLPGTRRLFVYLGAERPSAKSIILAIKAGRSFLSRGATVDFTLAGERPGAEVDLPGAGKATPPGPLSAHVSVQSPTPLRAVELVQNGRVVSSQDAGGKTAWQGDFPVPPVPGWCLVRAFAPGDDIPVCMTNPIWLGPKSATGPITNGSRVALTPAGKPAN